MSQVSVQIKGLDRLQRSLHRYPQIAGPVLQRAIDASQAVLATHTKRDNPVPYQTGFLLASFRWRQGRLSGRWFPTVRYAKFVHDGTRPHTIRTRNKRVLANRRTGRVFGRMVNHPGTKPNPFMEKIAERAQPGINQVFKKATDDIARDIARAT